MNKAAVFPSCYLPPVSAFSIMLQYEQLYIEKHEHFVKQTYRNRCYIYGANGPLFLVIPLTGSTDKIPVKDIRIANGNAWQKLHWRSMEAACRRTPFFEYYEDDIRPYYTKRYEFLLDFNSDLFRLICSLLKLELNIEFTPEYRKGNPDVDDYRQQLSPKRQHFDLPCKPYPQAFENKMGFIPNLSIVDLLFNQGPGAAEFL